MGCCGSGGRRAVKAATQVTLRSGPSLAERRQARSAYIASNSENAAVEGLPAIFITEGPQPNGIPHKYKIIYNESPAVQKVLHFKFNTLDRQVGQPLSTNGLLDSTFVALLVSRFQQRQGLADLPEEEAQKLQHILEQLDYLQTLVETYVK